MGEVIYGTDFVGKVRGYSCQSEPAGQAFIYLGLNEAGEPIFQAVDQDYAPSEYVAPPEDSA